MSTVKRCDVCKTVSDVWLPKGWKTVANLSVMAFQPLLADTNVCDECWKFLIDNRENLHDH